MNLNSVHPETESFTPILRSFSELYALRAGSRGLSSSAYPNLDRIKKKRKLLPIIHGLNNLVVPILALPQIMTGWGIYNTFVLGN
jgi:hypothetical protein